MFVFLSRAGKCSFSSAMLLLALVTSENFWQPWVMAVPWRSPYERIGRSWPESHFTSKLAKCVFTIWLRLCEAWFMHPKNDQTVWCWFVSQMDYCTRFFCTIPHTQEFYSNLKIVTLVDFWSEWTHSLFQEQSHHNAGVKIDAFSEAGALLHSKIVLCRAGQRDIFVPLRVESARLWRLPLNQSGTNSSN